jgi:hypothetical protein
LRRLPDDYREWYGLSVWGGESIHDAILSALTSAPSGKKIAKYAFTWNGDGTVATIKAYDGSDALLFTLAFTWNDDGSLDSITRS